MTSEKTKPRSRKIIGIIFNVLLYVFFAICLFSLVITVTAKRDSDGAVGLFGMQMRVVVSDSMAECPETDISGYEIGSIPLRSMVFIETVPQDETEAKKWYASLKVGDVLTFRYVYVTQETITHRITAITPKEGGGYIIELTGDNKASDADTLTQTVDTSLPDSPNYIVGRVTGQSYLLGLFVTMLKSPIGIICIIIIPCLIIAILEVIRLVSILGADKKEREMNEKQQRDAEFEEMKRQLELLQQQNQSTSPAVPQGDAQEGPRAESTSESKEE